MGLGLDERSAAAGMKPILLKEEVQAKIEQIGRADILVGIPSYNNARTIAHVVRAVQAGLVKYFPDARSVIVNSDGGSRDGTMDLVNTASLETFARSSSQTGLIPSSGSSPPITVCRARGAPSGP